MITYNASLDTDRKKLDALYLIIEKLRLWHNQEGARVKSFPDLKDKWTLYALRSDRFGGNLFWHKALPLYQARNALRDKIRDANFTKAQWSRLTDLQRMDAMFTLCGNRQTQVEGLQLTDTLPIAYDGFDQLKSVDLTNLSGTLPPDPTENFTTYTLQDSGSDATVAAAKVTLTTMVVTANMYIYSDKGAGHFGDFSHLYDWQITYSADEPYMGLYAIGNSYGTHTDQMVANNTLGVVCYIWNIAPNRCRIRVQDYSDDSIDTFDLQNFNQYWNTTARSSTTFTNSCYSDSGRTTLTDAQSTTCPNTTYRYVQGPFSQEAASGSIDISYWVENLDLQEVSGTTATPSTIALQTASKTVSLGYGCFVPVSSLYLTPKTSVPNFGYPIPTINLKTTRQTSLLGFEFSIPTIALKLGLNIPAVVATGGQSVTIDTLALYLTELTSSLQSGINIPTTTLKLNGQTPSLGYGLYVPTLSLKLNNQTSSLGYGVNIPVTSLKLNPYTSSLQIGISIPQLDLKTGLSSPTLGFSFAPITIALNLNGQTPAITVVAPSGTTLTPDTIALILNTLIPNLFGGNFPITLTGRYAERPSEAWANGLTKTSRYGSQPSETWVDGLTKTGRYSR